MQRGGNWDNSDVNGARKVHWLSSDKEYASGGFRKSQSISILGEGAGLDWTGKREKSSPNVATAPEDEQELQSTQCCADEGTV